jgi:CDP-ribitol ribitolphosphotransferase
MTGSAVEIVGLRWERIQVTFRVRLTDEPETTTLSAFALTRGGGTDRDRMAATHAAFDGSVAELRFNVMLGPGQRPLYDGRWSLTVDGAGGVRPVPLAGDAAIDAMTSSRSFALSRSRYDVVARIDPRDRNLAFDVARVGATSRSGGPSGRLKARLRPWVGTVRRLPRRAVVGLARTTARRDPRRIVFAAASASDLHGNLQVVHDRMVERGLDREYRLATLFGSRNRPNARMPIRELWRSARVLKSAGAVLVAGSRQRSAHEIVPEPGSRYIQLWHASGAFKTVGYSRVG